MLKRQQVLLNDWLIEYIKFTAEKYDWSFSETVRLVLCVEIASWVSAMYPKYKTKISNKDLANEVKKVADTKIMEEKHHRLISELYFEARKAAEFLIMQEKKAKE